MNDTPQGDGNILDYDLVPFQIPHIRMNDTPQGDGNNTIITPSKNSSISIRIRMNDTPQGDGNMYSSYS